MLMLLCSKPPVFICNIFIIIQFFVLFNFHSDLFLNERSHLEGFVNFHVCGILKLSLVVDFGFQNDYFLILFSPSSHTPVLIYVGLCTKTRRH